MSEAKQHRRRRLTRREALKAAAAGLYAAGTLDASAARALHALVQEETARGQGYTPKAFTAHELATVRRLAEMIIPADEMSGSAVDAGAPELIDLLASENEELARILAGGVHWLDGETRRRSGARFVEAAAEEQARLLDELAEATREPPAERGLSYDAVEYRRFADYEASPDSPVRGGARFFGWVRRLTVDAFYTSEIGYADVDYRGNEYLRRYATPREAVEYALARSPFKGEM